MGQSVSQSIFFSLFNSKLSTRQRKEILLLAKSLKDSNSQEIKIIDFSCNEEKLHPEVKVKEVAD